MNDSNDVERLLALLAEEEQPRLSPYFESRLRRTLAEAGQADLKVSLRLRQAAVVFFVFASVVLWSFPYLRWLIPLMVIQCLPEDWAAAIAGRTRRVRL